MLVEKALHYCRSILQNVSRSFALTIPMVEKNIILPILVGYLEARIMDSFEDENPGSPVPRSHRIENISRVLSIINDPDSPEAEGRMREIEESAEGLILNPHYLDLTRNMDKVMALHRTMDSHAKSTISLWFTRMAEGMQKYVGRSIETFDQLDEYCYYVGGTVGGLLTDLVIENTKKATSEQARIMRLKTKDFGLFLQKVNIIRDFRQDILGNEKIFWPLQAFREQGLTPAQALERRNSGKSLAVLDRMVSDAVRHVRHVKRYLEAIPSDYPGYRKASAINFLLGAETLERVRNNPEVFFGPNPVKVSPETRERILADPIGCLENV